MTDDTTDVNGVDSQSESTLERGTLRLPSNGTEMPKDDARDAFETLIEDGNQIAANGKVILRQDSSGCAVTIYYEGENCGMLTETLLRDSIMNKKEVVRERLEEVADQSGYMHVRESQNDTSDWDIALMLEVSKNMKAYDDDFIDIDGVTLNYINTVDADEYDVETFFTRNDVVAFMYGVDDNE